MQVFTIPDNGSINLEADPVDAGAQPGNITTPVEWSVDKPDLVTVNVDTGSPPHRRCQFVAKGAVGSVIITATAKNDAVPDAATVSSTCELDITATPTTGFVFKAV